MSTMFIAKTVRTPITPWHRSNLTHHSCCCCQPIVLRGQHQHAVAYLLLLLWNNIATQLTPM